MKARNKATSDRLEEDRPDTLSKQELRKAIRQRRKRHAKLLMLRESGGETAIGSVNTHDQKVSGKKKLEAGSVPCYVEPEHVAVDPAKLGARVRRKRLNTRTALSLHSGKKISES